MVSVNTESSGSHVQYSWLEWLALSHDSKAILGLILAANWDLSVMSLHALPVPAWVSSR